MTPDRAQSFWHNYRAARRALIDTDKSARLVAYDALRTGHWGIGFRVAWAVAGLR